MDRMYKDLAWLGYYDEPLKPPMWNNGEDKYSTSAKWRNKKSKIESKSDKKKRRKKGRK